MERKISYKREMNHNYLMIEGDPVLEDSYEARMLLANSVEGLLKFRIKRIDNRCYFCYEITSRQPLDRLLESKSLQVHEIRRMIQGVARALEGMEEYLLKEQQILLKPEFIYVEPETFQISLCLLPGEEADFPGQLSRLLEYLLGHVDYQDKDGVIMAYGLYRESLKENYGMNDLLGMLSIKSDKEEGPLPEPELKSIIIQEQPAEEKKVFPKKENVAKKKGSIAWLACLPGSFFLLWLIKGMGGLERYGLILAVGELCMIVLLQMIRARKKPAALTKTISPEEKEPWKMVFAEEIRENKPEIPLQMWETGGDTVLLVDKGEKKTVRRLESLGQQAADIPVSYYPFIIGKQENLVDYIFPGDTVSRLHLRLDESEGVYQITDLNSTNGTMVNGRLLEANETVVLAPGDEVNIAEYRFKFM